MRAFARFGTRADRHVGLLPAAHRRAENRTFIIPNNADGYGVDRCLANGERCGPTVATTYCQSQSFAQARSFRKIERDEITGAVPTSGRNACRGELRQLRRDQLLALSFPERPRSSRYARRKLRSFLDPVGAFRHVASSPHGMIGTVEVEFFGEPSMMRSE